jgi:putative oxidoreductase
MAHGTQKLFGFPLSEPAPPVDLTSLRGVAGILETFGGGLMLVGFLTRPVAFVLAGQMAYAYFSAHAPGGFWPILNRGELAALYAFIWLYFAAAGPGPWSIDSLLVRRATSRDEASRDEVSRDSLTSPSWSTPRSTTTRSRDSTTSRPRRS